MIPANQALERLRKGNHRYVAELGRSALSVEARRRQLVEGQEPFAVILGCADSRVPAELVFDQGLGDLFVIRVAGNIATPSQIGSVEFAVERLGTRLVVVLGHSGCGAVAATLEELADPAETSLPNLASIVECIRPHVEPLLATESRDALLPAAVRANIRAAAHRLRTDSPFLTQRLTDDELLVVGAEYCLASGVVDFFDGV